MRGGPSRFLIPGRDHCGYGARNSSWFRAAIEKDQGSNKLRIKGHVNPIRFVSGAPRRDAGVVCRNVGIPGRHDVSFPGLDALAQPETVLPPTAGAGVAKRLVWLRNFACGFGFFQGVG